MASSKIKSYVGQPNKTLEKCGNKTGDERHFLSNIYKLLGQTWVVCTDRLHFISYMALIRITIIHFVWDMIKLASVDIH